MPQAASCAGRVACRMQAKTGAIEVPADRGSRAETMDFHWHNVVGGVGVVTLLTTYLLLQLNYISAKSLRYSLFNAVGAAAILVSLTYNFNLSAFVIESCWLLISCIGAVVSVLDKRKSMTPE